MHLTDERIHTLSPAVKAAHGGARRLVLELDDLSPDGFLKLLAGSPQLVSLMLFTDGRRLRQVLSPDDYRVVSEALAQSGAARRGGGALSAMDGDNAARGARLRAAPHEGRTDTAGP